MNKKLILSSLILAFGVLLSPLFAQTTNIDGNEILKKAATAYKDDGTVTLDFTMTSKQKDDNESYEEEGKATMVGQKFKIIIPQATIWFDGETQWVYVADSDEVNITNPEDSELRTMNPEFLFDTAKSGYQIMNSRETDLNGQQAYLIEMKPNKMNDLADINIVVSKKDYRVMEITIIDNDAENKFTVKNYKTQIDQAPNFYKFNPDDYPDAEIVDLR